MPIGESIQLYNALKILGKPVEFITVDGETILYLIMQNVNCGTIQSWLGLPVGCRIVRHGGMTFIRKDIGDVLINIDIKKPFPRIDKGGNRLFVVVCLLLLGHFCCVLDVLGFLVKYPLPQCR